MSPLLGNFYKLCALVQRSVRFFSLKTTGGLSLVWAFLLLKTRGESVILSYKNGTLCVQNDKLKLLKPGSLQHLGENMLAFLLKVATSAHLPKGKATDSRGKSDQDTAIYFDILVCLRTAILLFNLLILGLLNVW